MTAVLHGSFDQQGPIAPRGNMDARTASVIADNQWGRERNDDPMRDLTQEERDILFILGSAARGEAALDQVHPSDTDEFRRAIHAAQNIILARPAQEFAGGFEKEGGRVDGRDGHGRVDGIVFERNVVDR